MSIFEKIILFLRKPNVVVLTENNKNQIKKIAVQIVGSSAQIEKEVFFVNDIKKLFSSGRETLVCNFDKNGLRRIKEKTPNARILTFGFQEGADFQASDLRQNGGTNFKINYQGKSVPVWLIGNPDREEIYSVLAAAAVGTLLGLNLVEISQALKPPTILQ